MPAPMPSANGTLEGVAVPLADFQKLTKISIVVYYGDNIPEQPTRARRKTTGASASRWRGCGAMPSTGMAVTSRSFICRRSASAATRISRSPT